MKSKGDYRKKFVVEPGAKPRLADIAASCRGDHESREKAEPEIARSLARLGELQYLLYASRNRSLLIVLQGLDAAGKDGVIRHVFTGMNPQGTSVACFKQPSPEELAHDFLWRIHKRTPGKGEVVVFNRSHYEDVLVVRVHDLVPPQAWSGRYDLINAFEKTLTEGGTTILKFYLHISPEEQLARFKDRLDDDSRHWKISESDYTERDFWPAYVEAYEEVFARTSTEAAPWYIVPSNHKWFRNLAIARIIAETLDELDIRLPHATVDIDAIRRRFHAEKELQETRQQAGDKSS